MPFSGFVGIPFVAQWFAGVAAFLAYCACALLLRTFCGSSLWFWTGWRALWSPDAVLDSSATMPECLLSPCQGCQSCIGYSGVLSFLDWVLRCQSCLLGGPWVSVLGELFDGAECRGLSSLAFGSGVSTCDASCLVEISMSITVWACGFLHGACCVALWYLDFHAVPRFIDAILDSNVTPPAYLHPSSQQHQTCINIRKGSFIFALVGLGLICCLGVVLKSGSVCSRADAYPEDPTILVFGFEDVQFGAWWILATAAFLAVCACVRLLSGLGGGLSSCWSCLVGVSVDSSTKVPVCQSSSRPRRLPCVGNRGCPTFLAFVLLCLSCRIGEARKPGPEWSIAVANLSGLNTRAFGFADSHYDVWLFSETHLTQIGLKVFWNNVRTSNPAYKSFQHGCPIAPRSEASDIGQWSGVGVMAKFPVRRLPHSWPSCMYNSGRLVCTSFCAHGLWISGVVVYGIPTGPTHPKGREVTNELLAQALDRIEQTPGPRYIAGDFNHDLDRLATIEVMHRLGYQDIQDLAAERTGRLPQATCRDKTRRDFLFVSRELASLFVSCSLDEEVVADHSYLIGKFRGGDDEVYRFAWPIPDPMEWEPPDLRSPVGLPLFENPGHLTQDYANFWKGVEASNMRARTRKQKPIIRTMHGRAQQLQPVRRLANLAPLKTSRPGDRQPAFLGSCLQHAQWMKQHRRLQSYVRLCASELPTAAHRAHQFRLWSAILQARGFIPSFSVWWGNRALGIGEPAFVPTDPPCHAVALLFLAGIDLEFSQLETALNKARSHANRLQKASDAHAMYRTVKRNAPAQVDSLALQQNALVAELDEEECAVVTTEAVSWYPDVPILHNGQPLTVICRDSDKLWLESCHDIQPGDTLTQKKLVGRLPDLFDAFEQQWAKLWNRHADIPASQWDQIVEFARTQLQPVVADPPDISAAAVSRTLKSKSKHAATSLDGVSRSDVLALKPQDLELLCRAYGLICSSGCWPDQTLKGYVRSLAKVDDPTQVSHFRPITVFSNFYRTWSSIAARHWLKLVSDVVDPLLCGNTVGGRAAMVWRHMLAQVEMAHLGARGACGFSADIVKAFNILPRHPAFAAMKMLGVDHGTLTAWAGALHGFVRHFVIQGNYSPGVRSCNRFPEGCALSCLAMLSLTQLFHRWMIAANTLFKPVSYVDNWGVILESVDYMRQACQAVDEFAAALQLDLDPAKSYCWAADRPGRRALRDAGFVVKLRNRELGAHEVFSKQLSNFHQVERFRQLGDFWQKLANSRCTFQQKITLIKRVAWPRAFHAVSAVVVGRKHFESLRTSVMQALRIQKPGANPELQCSLEGDAFDPTLFAAIDTVRDARSLGDTQSVAVDLAEALFDAEEPQHNSLSEILGQRLHKIGFTVTEDAKVADAIGPLDFLKCPLQEFIWRAQWTWTQVLAGVIKHRKSFRGFEFVDLPATRKAYQSFQPYEQGILRKHLHGASFTNEQVQHWSESGSAVCGHCGAVDSTYHRLWTCPFTLKLRDDIPSDVLTELDLLPRVVIEHGWTLRSPLANDWFRYLDSLPREPSFHVPPSPGVILDLFTDGSCLFPRESAYRVASWAVVQAPPFGLQVQRAEYKPIAAQPLSGLLQTAYRAELTAVIAAIRYASMSRSCVRIWTDCQSVIRAFQKHVRDGCRVRPNGRNSDLLVQLQEQAAQLGHSRIALLKVPAHEDRSHYDSDIERWLVDGNNAVDAAAAAANQARPPAVWNLWSAYVDQVCRSNYVSAYVRSHIVAVGRLWTQSGPVGVQPVPPPPRPVRLSSKHPALIWEDPFNLELQGPTFRKFFGSSLAVAVHSWISAIRDVSQQLQWISYLQLYKFPTSSRRVVHSQS